MEREKNKKMKLVNFAETKIILLVLYAKKKKNSIWLSIFFGTYTSYMCDFGGNTRVACLIIFGLYQELFKRYINIKLYCYIYRAYEIDIYGIMLNLYKNFRIEI